MVLGWFWGSSSSNDPVKNLDPSLEKVLKSQESRPSSLPKIESQTSYTQKLRETGDLPPARTSDSQSQPQSKVPPQSLFQDGRYAHLWKNYEPQAIVESRGETEIDKLKRLSEDNEMRRIELGKAALENCVFEQLAEVECLRNGSAYSKMTLCRPEKKTFLDCYEMQCKFLKALGYWDAVGDPPRADAIQMHSDKLWQRLKAQEAEIKKAKEEGRPVPQFDSILSPENVRAVGGSLKKLALPLPASNDGNYPYPSIPPDLRESFDKRIKNMSKEEAKVEEAVFLAEMEQKRSVILQGVGYLRAEGDARRKRFESGEATIGDRIKRWTNWDAWDSKFPLPADAQARQQPQAALPEVKK
ncbi:uncharacterized protein PV09_02009 [Verruconis gallopava]|uniref:Uncharacterized protein n=1 Tax=Verruconis gallopava TaxID=253628 RepID=A0A0D1Z2G8_9PEZI|nr:uncharacterized protein PV09_02009 [Verruconis gallopava]KIW07137.1 hypothetical protein PV09_02009 [Verruconis gallopava]